MTWDDWDAVPPPDPDNRLVYAFIVVMSAFFWWVGSFLRSL